MLGDGIVLIFGWPGILGYFNGGSYTILSIRNTRLL